mgnify:CR=1 FL=1
MIRERVIGTIPYQSGGISTIQIPRDSVFHSLQLSIMGGTFSTVQGAGGTGPTLVPGFPFSLIRGIRVIRNGSDVVFQGSGEQLAKHCYELNKSHPQARLYTTAANVESLRTAVVRTVTVPANSQGIGENVGGFTVPNAPNDTGTVQFDMQLDLWFQLGVDNGWATTLVDARPLSSFDLEITWAAEASQIALAGVTNGASTAAGTLQLMSLDQDNVTAETNFGTFKRSSVQYANIPYGSDNNQVILPRGNFFYAIQMQTRAYKAGSALNPVAENAVIGLINNRINSNYYLRQVDFARLQAKNMADFGGRQNAFGSAQGSPQGFATLNYVNAGQEFSELVTSYAMDQFDLQLSTQPLAAAMNGPTTGGTNPVIDLLYQEVIPGVSKTGIGPQGASAGSIAKTSAQPYR